jgi:ribonuclease PH
MTSSGTASRADGRADDELRAIKLTRHWQDHPAGSVLVEFGRTRVLCAASASTGVPRWRKGSELGWVTAEYAMLPSATNTRSDRESVKGRIGGRTHEISRLIGRSLRAVIDYRALGENTIVLDCDVLQADGGTRTAAITGAWVAAVLALSRLLLTREITAWPIRDQVAAVSVGLLRGTPLLDLEYVEDQVAEVDMNVVATAGGSLIEIQGTGEKRSFSRAEMDALVDLAFKGIGELAAAQNAVLAPTLEEVDAVLAKSHRRPAPAKSEKDLWGRP